jgi:hypothetical protein
VRIEFIEASSLDQKYLAHIHYARLIDSYTSADARISPDRLKHEAILIASPFNLVERIGANERRLVPLERLVDRALSMSTSSPDHLRPLKDRLAQEIMDQMSQLATNGAVVVGVIESQALIARRGENGHDSPTLNPSLVREVQAPVDQC